MKRLPLLLLSGLAVAAMAACGGKTPETTPAPVAVNQDSSDAAQRAAEEARQRAEKEARDREAAEREARQRAADSLAALGKSTEAVRTLLATMIHFDYDKAIIRGGDAAVPDQKGAILPAKPGLPLPISGQCHEGRAGEYNPAPRHR